MAKYQIISQFLKDLSFESPNVPELFFKKDTGDGRITIIPNIKIKVADNNVYMVDLIVKAKADLENESKSIWLIETTYSSLVKIEEFKDEDEKEHILFVNVPEITLPYIKTLVSHIISDSGFPPIRMQNFDFEKILKDMKDKQNKK